VLPWLIGLAAIGGSILYGVGLLSWWGGTAFMLRLLGWLLMTLALAIPSTMTLALPLVALLVPTLVTIGDERQPKLDESPGQAASPRLT
jgi:hypothetical protein